MKKILFTLLLLSLLPFGASAGPVRSKVLVVRVTTSNDWAAIGYNDDRSRRMAAQVMQICTNRGIDVVSIEWRGDTDNLEYYTVTHADDYDFAIFVGGYSYQLSLYTAPKGAVGGAITDYIDPDNTKINVDNLWLFGGDGRENDASYATGLGSGNDQITAQNYDHFYVHGYSGALDTIKFYAGRGGVNGYVGEGDGSTVIDTILTYTGFGEGASEGYLALWSQEADGVTHYYSCLHDGTFGLVVDALICKHCTHFDPLYFAIDIDDFGMDKQGGIGGPNTDPDIDWVINDSNFWNHIDSLFQAIEDYDLKLTIGATTKYKRSVNNDENQWQEWYGLRTRWKDNDHLAWVWHNHGLENPADSASALFPDLATYRHFTLGEASGEDTVERMDSLYQVDVDSLEAWGFTVAPYVIPPWDQVDGHYDDLRDSVATFCANNGLALRAKYSESTSSTVYSDTQEWLGCKVLNAHYLTNTIDTTYVTNTTMAYEIWTSFFGPNFFFSSDMTGQNPDVANTGDWHGGANVTLLGNEYTPRTSRVTVLHFGACYKNSETITMGRNAQVIKEIGKTINYLEWLAGKDIYQCKFAHELAHDPVCWRQIK